MSEISSTSELTTKEIVEQAIQDYHNTILPYLAKGNNGYSETPIGAMQMFDDDTAPSGWLVADGTVYNIDDYPFLASHYERVHGSKNYYGGDGTTTFAVPNWQGEFFRASGTNSHANQGSGANVGVHQDGTEHWNTYCQAKYQQSFYALGTYIPDLSTESGIEKHQQKTDSTIQSEGYISNTSLSGAQETRATGAFTSRPTNTSLLCCIKAVPAGINYSLEEQVFGTWIDGKPLYQKTIEITSLVSGEHQYSTGLTGLDSLHVLSNGSYVVDSNGTIWDIGSWNGGIVSSVANYSFFNVWTKPDNGNIDLYIGSGLHSIAIKAVITVRYTKTTDV